jgi:hypothetical protein
MYVRVEACRSKMSLVKCKEEGGGKRRGRKEKK